MLSNLKHKLPLFFNKITFIILILLGFYITLNIISNTFDGDFGWHLRFGKEALENNFQYLDSYTWYLNSTPWVNHEWGGDIIFWILNNHFGYFSLVLLVSLFIWVTFLLAPLIYRKKISIISIIFSILAILSVKFTIMMRLCTMSAIFPILLIISLENLPKRKNYFILPILFWLWSFFHGSWVLGFIIINIYIIGNLFQLFINKLKPNTKYYKFIHFFKLKQTLWDHKIILKLLIAEVVCILIILLNPYGAKIWTEVFHYFINGYYKMHITEWTPSFAYPIYWAPLLIANISIVITCFDWKKKNITWPQALIFISFFMSAMFYRRNNLLLILVCIPILVTGWEYLKELPIKIKSIVYYPFIYIIISIYLIFFASPLRINHSIWQDVELLYRYKIPVHAIEFLKQRDKDQTNIRLFNKYYWGGYLNWVLPNHLVFLDGRSAATWKAPDGEPALKKYFDITGENNQLIFLEQNQVQYVMLPSYNIDYQSKPDSIKRLIFTQKDFEILFSNQPLQIELDLVSNPNWQLIYHDQLANIWEYSPQQPQEKNL